MVTLLKPKQWRKKSGSWPPEHCKTDHRDPKVQIEEKSLNACVGALFLPSNHASVGQRRLLLLQLLKRVSVQHGGAAWSSTSSAWPPVSLHSAWRVVVHR